MGDTIYQGPTGLQIDTYVAPADSGRPRARVQIHAFHPDTNDRQILQLDLEQWVDLCAGVREPLRRPT